MWMDGVYISPKYRVMDYKGLHLTNSSPSDDWGKAISIFQDRMESRFILVAQDMLLKLKDDFGHIDYSFSIMALNCLVIETLRQFENGLDTTLQRANQKAFESFFKQSRFFNFNKKTSELFYQDVRCGILHQAQTKKNTQLTFDQINMIEHIEGDSIRVDVEKFTYALIDEYEYYVQRLRDQNEVGLRTNFIQKMNYIINRIASN